MIFLLILVIIPDVFSLNDSAPCLVNHHSPVNWTVDCSSTRLIRLPASLEGLPVINVILRHNHLDSKINFQNWSQLRRIDLSYNDIQIIPDMMFSEFKELTSLNLSSNDLRSISGDYFVNTLYIEVLDLSYNLQLSTHNYFLVDLRKIVDRGLRELILRGINLKWIPQYYFQRSYDLKSIDLSHNNLKELPPFPTNLVQLDLSDNLFSRIGLTQFRDCLDLEVLIVEDNRYLKEITEDAFHYTRKLNRVSLKGNYNLTDIPEGLFAEIPLKNLSLANCQFKTLASSFREPFIRLNYIDLRNNPWDCGSHLEWFFELKTDVNDDRLRCQNTDTSFAEFYDSTVLIDHGFLKDILVALMIIIVILFGLSIWFVYSLEFRTKVKNLYSPLDTVTNLTKPVYVSTVRSCDT